MLQNFRCPANLRNRVLPLGWINEALRLRHSTLNQRRQRRNWYLNGTFARFAYVPADIMRALQTMQPFSPYGKMTPLQKPTVFPEQFFFRPLLYPEKPEKRGATGLTFRKRLLAIPGGTLIEMGEKGKETQGSRTKCRKGREP